jgi:hypothetical protein
MRKKMMVSLGNANLKFLLEWASKHEDNPKYPMAFDYIVACALCDRLHDRWCRTFKHDSKPEEFTPVSKFVQADMWGTYNKALAIRDIMGRLILERLGKENNADNKDR